MNKKILLFVSLFLSSTFAFSGGLVTNTNQSAAWTRMLIRDASTGIDAVFYNPAGLSKLSDGFHFSINNQTLFQTQNITSTFPYLNGQDYEGTVKAPVFPGAYGVYKKNKIAVSFGFNPVGGGGGATFENGLPSMEIPFAGLVPALGASAYSMNMFFEGTSVYFGLQAGLTYEVCDAFSVYVGGRYIMAKNTYAGYIKDVKLTTPLGVMAPGTYVSALSSNASASGTALAQIVGAGAGGYTLTQLVGASILTAAQKAGMEALLASAGLTPAQIGAMTAAQLQPVFGPLAAGLAQKAAVLNIVTADQEADVVQEGDGFTPIIGANLTLMDKKLNIGIKYEFLTKMNLVDYVANVGGKELGFIDGVTPTGTPTYMFADGNLTKADIPAFLSLGANYKLTDKFNVAVGYHTYFDEKANWATNDEGKATVDKNFMEYGVGLEYALTEKFLISAGYLGTKTSATEFYNDDLSYSLNTNTVGGGGAYKLNDTFTFQFGGFYTMYQDDTFDKTYTLQTGNVVPFKETYDKMTWAVSFGVDISLGKKAKE